MTNREQTDAFVSIHGDTRVARLTGLHGETVTVEQWGGDIHYDPVVLVHGPKGAEKYRFAATGDELVAFAHNVLAWDEGGRPGQEPGQFRNGSLGG
jgi:hypothetical protein